MTKTQEEATGFIRPSPEMTNNNVWSKYLPKPTYTWEDYLQQMTIACAKLKLSFQNGYLCVFGVNSRLLLLFAQIQQINISDEDKLEWQTNKITSTFFAFHDIYIYIYIYKFYRIKQIFSSTNTWQKPVTLSLKYEEDDRVYLYTD